MKDIPRLTHPTAEITTLAALRRGDMDTAVFLADTLSVEDYSDPRRQVVFQAAVNVLRGIEPLDDDNILAESIGVARDLGLTVRIDEEYLRSLDGDLLRARTYANTVKRMSWLRGAGDFAHWLVKELQDFPDPDDLFAAAQERMQVLQPKTDRRDFVYGWDTTGGHQQDIEQRMADYAAGKVSPFLWPWASWNSVIRPMGKGQFGVLAAPDGVGKSTYLEIIAEKWARGGLHVVYVHLEDDLQYKLDRRLARWARVPLADIEDGRFTADQLKKVREAQKNLGEHCNTLHYLHAPGWSAASIVQELDRRVQEGVCQAVVLDYLDKMAPSRASAKLFGDNLWARQGADAETLKTFAEKNALPVLSATQGNKDMQGPGLQTRKNISGGGGKSHPAQFIFILTRDIVGEGGLYSEDKKKLADAGELSPLCNIRVDKQNRGKVGITIRQFLIGQFLDIKDIERKGA